VTGASEGLLDGCDDGTLDGIELGTPEGSPDGIALGHPEGLPDGCAVGTLDVGRDVGNDEVGLEEGDWLLAVHSESAMAPAFEFGKSAGHATHVILFAGL
jgi:hypothetical protein